jgi:D-methionine transport system ATP-binding protein
MINMSNIRKVYENGKQQTIALEHIDITVRKGEIFGVIGHSGAGKSTLIRCINLLERPTSGQVIVDGTDLTKLDSKQLQAKRRKIGMIFQHFNLLTSATVFDNVAFSLELEGKPKTEIRRKVDELLQLVGLEEHAQKFPSQLSGGQKQRVGIARALASDPKVLLCDEATSALDPQTTESILSLLLDINRKLELTIVLITHEMHVIRSICDRVAVIDGGRIVESGDVIDVFLQPKHPTTRDFVSHVTHTDELTELLKQVPAGSLMRISFRGDQTYEPILFELMKETGQPFSILQGSISQMKNTPYGQLLVQLHGESSSYLKAVSFLRERGLEVEVL